MSITTVSEARIFLSIIHNDDDARLQMLLNSAEKEALEYMDRTQFGELCPCDSNYEEESENMQPDVKMAVLLLAQALFEGNPSDQMELRKLAEKKLDPHRCNLGV